MTMRSFGLSLIVLFSSLTTASSLARGEHKKTETFGRNLKETVPQQACDDELDAATLCTCQDLNENVTVLSCEEIDCLYCNANQTTCGVESFDKVFGLDGVATAIEETFTYTKGRSGAVTIQKMDCGLDADDNEVCNSCMVIVGDVECDSCTLNVCSAGSKEGEQHPSFECGSIEPGSSYDLCDDGLIVPEGSVFEAFSGNADDFDVCLDPPAPPTDAPTRAPTVKTDEPSMIPSDGPSLMPSLSSPPTATATKSPTGSPTVSQAPTTNRDLSGATAARLSVMAGAVVSFGLMLS